MSVAVRYVLLNPRIAKSSKPLRLLGIHCDNQRLDLRGRELRPPSRIGLRLFNNDFNGLSRCALPLSLFFVS